MLKEEIILISRNELEQLLASVIRNEIENLHKTDKITDLEDDDLISFNEALRLLKISRPTLFKHMKNGIIPYRKVGRRLLFPKQIILKKIALKK